MRILHISYCVAEKGGNTFLTNRWTSRQGRANGRYQPNSVAGS